MFLKRKYKGKGEKQQEEFADKYKLRTKECIGYVREHILYEGKWYWIRTECEKKFKTKDPTKVFCSDSCRIQFHCDRRIKERSGK